MMVILQNRNNENVGEGRVWWKWQRVANF